MPHTQLSPHTAPGRATSAPDPHRSATPRRHTLETTGQVSPFPLVGAKRTLALLPVGDELTITLDCSQSTRAIGQWAAESGHPVTRTARTRNNGWSITVRRG